MPLSVWLRGGHDLEKHPRGALLFGDWIQKTSIESEEIVDGLICIKLRCETWDKGERPTLNTLRFLWLAPERNYLPVKTESYLPDVSLELSVGVGFAKGFREIEPGVWLPFDRAVTVYDSDKIREEKKQVFRNGDETRIEKANLHPQYDLSLFRDVPFPDGSIVYEMKDGKVIKSYKQGKDKEDEDMRQADSRMRWVIAAIAIVALLAGCGFAFHRLHTTRKQAA